jgi:deazaflavin-dependent oxidoreductase (nitroreductase family)
LNLKQEYPMPAQNHALKDLLSSSSEIKLTVTGRKSGRPISIPIWFVFHVDTIYLLPVKGSETQWYKNLLKNPSIEVEARGAKAESHGTPVTDPTQVKSVVEKFRGKYGAGDVKKYYSNFDVAVTAPIP